MRMRSDQNGASAPFSFSIAGAVLIIIIGSVFVATQQQGYDRSATDDQGRRDDAEALTGMFTDRAGVGWEGSADTITELGLMNQNGSGIDLAKMDTMKGALYDATDNGKLDYAEAQALLGMDPERAGTWHLRIAPVGLREVLTTDLSGIRTAYVGDYNDAAFSFSVAFASDEAMAAEAQAKADAYIAPAAASEREAIRTLGLGYKDQVHLADGTAITTEILGVETPLGDTIDPALLAGDVFPDQKQYLDLVLPLRLPEYEVLLIGSTVDQSSLTSAATKQAVAQWVLDGGTLIVFGSAGQNFQWLEPLFDVGTATVNGGSFAPDVDHPLLREPYPLDWDEYNNFGLGWNIKDKGNNAHYEDFQHVIVEDGEDVLAVSLDGAFGDGRIFLTSFRPADIASSINLQESMNLINNIVTFSYRNHLFLDYGPPPPQDQSVGAATRISHVWDPDFGQIPVHVTVLYWGF